VLVFPALFYQIFNLSRSSLFGFISVELLVVIAIIGVLTALLLPNVQTAKVIAKYSSLFSYSFSVLTRNLNPVQSEMCITVAQPTEVCQQKVGGVSAKGFRPPPLADRQSKQQHCTNSLSANADTTATASGCLPFFADTRLFLIPCCISY
jgi:type II secretory pathway pseudopilin PulG